MPALFFSAASGGVSGWGVEFALLRPGTGKELENFLPLELSLSNQSQHAFWDAPEISDAKILVTADYVRGPAEAHYEPHRFIISAYALKNPALGAPSYYLDDQYMTLRKYDSEKDADAILDSERPEIFTRLSRVKAANERP